MTSKVQALLGDKRFSVEAVKATGDCFYDCVGLAFQEAGIPLRTDRGHVAVDVASLRDLVARSLSEEQLGTFRMLCAAGVDDYSFVVQVPSRRAHPPRDAGAPHQPHTRITTPTDFPTAVARRGIPWSQAEASRRQHSARCWRRRAAGAAMGAARRGVCLHTSVCAFVPAWRLVRWRHPPLPLCRCGGNCGCQEERSARPVCPRDLR